MSRSSTARRTNIVLAAVAAGLVVIAAVAAVGGRQSTDRSSPTTTTTPVVTGPASVDGSWFGAVPVAEAVDYPVESLTCPSLALHLALDLCAVADGDDPYMVAGQEGYWSPDEPDPDGTVRIPFDVTIYVLAETDDGPVARPAMSAVVSLPYGVDYNELSLYRPSGRDLDGVIVLVWSARDTLQSPALDGVQVLAAVDGAPRVVATEIGTEVRVGSAGDALVFVTPHLGETTEDPLLAPSLAVVSLRADGDRWSREVTTATEVTDLGGFAAADRVNFYGFPRDR